jgi:dipeptidyl aminopeptidase/acylaminoacyl peptidase
MSKWHLSAFPFLVIALIMAVGDRSTGAEERGEAKTSAQIEFCSAAGGSAGEQRPIEINDYDCITEPSNPRISKDGRQIAYVLNNQLYVEPADGGDRWQPTNETWSWSPVWSSLDDDVLYFLSGTKKLTKLNKVSIKGNRQLSQLVCISKSIDDSLKLSPDEAHFLLELNTQQQQDLAELEISKDCPKLESSQMQPDTAESKPEAEDSKREPLEITGMVFKEDGTGYLSGENTNRIFAVDISNAVIRRITDNSNEVTDASGANNDTDAAWSPDGAKIAFIREYTSALEYHSEVWVTSSSGGDAPVKLTPWPKAGRGSPSWSGDGKFIAYLWSDAQHGPFAVSQLAIYSLAEGRERVLTTGLDRPVVSFQFSADSSFIYFIYADEGAQHLARIRLRDGEIEHLIKGKQFITSADVSREGHLAMLMRNTNDSSNVYLMRPGGEPVPLTDYNVPYLKGLKIVPREKVIIDVEDGLRMEAFVTKPINFDASRKYPTVLHIHGGPADEQYSYGYQWFPQFLAANGYVVVEPNPPGSFGRGQDNVRKIYRNWGCTDYPDVLLAIDYVIAIGLADPQKLGVTGYSYGGYMTNCIITRTPRKFQAAASGAGHSLIVANYGHDMWLKWYKWELGAPWQNRDMFEELSPLNKVGFVETPTLFLSGDADWNVPILNSELFYQSLRVKGVDTKLVVYPDTGHVNWSTEFDTDYYQKILKWFDDYLK